MQRVRIGLTGLACVFLVVLLAAVLLGLAGEQEPLPPASTQNAAMPEAEGADVAEDEAVDPLAELGVAPGAKPDAEDAGANEMAP